MRRNLHRLAYFAYLQSNDSDGNLVVCQQRYVLALDLSESWGRNDEIVSARKQLREHESPFGVRLCRELRFPFLLSEDNRCARDRAVLRVTQAARNRATAGLRGQRRHRQRHRHQNDRKRF